MKIAKDKKSAILIGISLILVLISVFAICIISEKMELGFKTLIGIGNEKVNAEEYLTLPPKITVNPSNGEYAKSINVTIEVNVTTEVNKEDAIHIYNVDDLVSFRDSVNEGNDYSGKTVYLMSDIDMTTVCSDAIGSWEPIGATGTSFTGTFDGNYHTISNLYINSNQYSAAGLFFRNDGTIQNLLLSNILIYNYKTINESLTIGGISCHNYGTIKNCGILSGSIEGYNITTITSGWRNVMIGSINAINHGGGISNCFNKATIKATTYGGGSDAAYIGGINGGFENETSDKGYIENCYNAGNIIVNTQIGTSKNYSMIGGINGSVGTYATNKATISNCYNIGNISESGNGLMFGSINGNATSALTINNTYYTSDATAYNVQNSSWPSTNNVKKISLDELKTYAETLGEAYKTDSQNINEGYPILNWQGQDYQYYLSASETELTGGEWTNYKSGEEFTIGEGKTGIYYLFVKRISYEKGIVSEEKGTMQQIGEETYHRFGPYKFDNVAPIVQVKQLIYDVDDLIAFRNNVNKGDTYEGKVVCLMSDIDMSTVCSETVGSWEPIGTSNTHFKGTFDGNNYTIRGLYIEGKSDNQGLFGYNDGTIKNIEIENGYITSQYSNTGLICGTNTGTISNIETSGTVEGYRNVGGVVGYRYENSKILNCKNTANINEQKYTTSSECVGGIVGAGKASTIENCNNEGDVYGSKLIGGIAGWSEGMITIKNSSNIGNITASRGLARRNC